MKRVLSILFTIVMITALASCGSGEMPSEPRDTSSQSADKDSAATSDSGNAIKTAPPPDAESESIDTIRASDSRTNPDVNIFTNSATVTNFISESEGMEENEAFYFEETDSGIRIRTHIQGLVTHTVTLGNTEIRPFSANGEKNIEKTIRVDGSTTVTFNSDFAGCDVMFTDINVMFWKGDTRIHNHSDWEGPKYMGWDTMGKIPNDSVLFNPVRLETEENQPAPRSSETTDGSMNIITNDQLRPREIDPSQHSIAAGYTLQLTEPGVYLIQASVYYEYEYNNSVMFVMFIVEDV